METAPISFDRLERALGAEGAPRPRMPRVMDLATIMAERHPVQPAPRPDPIRLDAAPDTRQVFSATPGLVHRPRRPLRTTRTSSLARLGVRAAMAACAVAAVVIVPYVLTHQGMGGSAVVREAERAKAPTELQTGRSVSEPKTSTAPLHQP